jgi:Cell wall-active antibiotics response 4TMS YvqF
MTSGDEDSDEFRVAAIGAGKQFGSRAAGLRSGSAVALMGGAEIDLREATLDPGGATLDVTAILGGVQVTLPAGWNVQVESHGLLGGVDTQLTPATDLLPGAASLKVSTNTWLGGIQIVDRAPA